MGTHVRIWCRVLVAAFALAGCLAGNGSPAAAASPWLFVSDIHLLSSTRLTQASVSGEDTNAALFLTAIRQMQRVDPDPPVVVVSGDLLAHSMRDEDTTPTAVRVAANLGAAFPHAQFVLALGNNDSACGDYALAPNARFLRAVAAAWAPLVNRRGTAPGFMRTFPRDGFYVASLPVPGLRVIVVDDVFWSPRYRAGCGVAGDGGAQTFRELASALHGLHGPAWVVLHIPPGVDAYSTAYIAHRLAVIPFLAPDARDALLAALTGAAAHVPLVVAGHTHKFAYRIVDATGRHPVPMLLVPSISPIFGNGPSFLTARVAPDGTLQDVRETSFTHRHWRTAGDLRELGADPFTAPALLKLQGRLEREPALRARFDALYNGDRSSEITERNWRVYWCAATAFGSTAFRACDDAGGTAFVTRRGVDAIVVLAGLAALALTGVAIRVALRP